MAKKSDLNFTLILVVIFISAVFSSSIVFAALRFSPNLILGNQTNSDTVANLDEEIEKGIERFVKKQEEKYRKEQEAAQKAEENKKKDMPKIDKPSVELFVMSHCPFGTQIEKGMISVLETLGDKIDFELKFCDYVMHGEKEIDEQLKQHCLQKNNSDQFLPYLACFLKDGDSEACQKEVGINAQTLAQCVKEVDTEFKIKEKFVSKEDYKGQFPSFNIDKEANQKYGVRGSPSLVVNETSVSSGRDSASLLETICLGFKNPPEECQAELSSTPPAAGFGFEGSGTNSEASCG